MGLMKKLTSVVVTAGLLLGLVGTAFAAYPADSAASAKRMQDLGIVQGDAGGLRLGDSITRAELIKVIVWAFGKGNDAKFLKGAPAFPDTANHWASGEIALAKNMIEANGFKLGLPDGTFNPQANVTAAEAVAMVMKFMGAPADASQAWPNDYLNGAVAAGILSADDKATVAGVANAPATRGLVFYLADTAFSTYKLSSGKTVYTQYVRPTAPTLTIDEIAPTTDSSVTVTGSVSSAYTDPFVVTVGSSTNVATVSGGKFTATVSDIAMGDNNISVMVTDEAGNVVTKTVKVTRTAGAAATIDAPATLTVDAGATADLAVAVKDAKGNVVADAVPTVTSDLGTFADGKFTAGQKSGTGTISIALGDLTASVNVTVKAGPVAKLVIAPATVDLSAGGSQKFVAAGQDEFGNDVAVNASDITWSASKGIIGQDGSFGATSDATGTVTVTAAVGAVSGTATVTVFGTATKLAAAAPSNLVANGSSTGDLVVTVQDANGNVAKNYNGQLTFLNNSTSMVTLPGSNNTVTVNAVNGVATVTLTASNTNGTAVVSVSGSGLQGVAATVSIASQTATSVKVTADPTSVAADNNSKPTLKAVMLDQTGNAMVTCPTGSWSIEYSSSDSTILGPATPAAVYFATSSGKCQISTSTSFTAKNNLGSASISATVKKDGVASSTVTANSVSVSTTLVGAPYKLAIDAISNALAQESYTGAGDDDQSIVVRIQDINGNQVTGTNGGFNVTLTADSDSSATLSAGTVAASNGKATFTANDTVAETTTYTATATWNGITLASATAPGTITPGPAKALKLSVSPGTIYANGSSTTVLKATVVDSASNGSGSWVYGNSVTTGVYNVTFKRTQVGTGGNNIPAVANWADTTVATVNGVATLTVTGTANISTDSFQATFKLNNVDTLSAETKTISTALMGSPSKVVIESTGDQTQSANNATAGQDYTVKVDVKDYASTTVTYDQSTVVTLTATDPNGVVTSYTATDVNGVATFTLNLKTSFSSNYALKASATNLKSDDGTNSTTGQPLKVVAGKATAVKVSAGTTTLGADGHSYTTVTFKLGDAYGNTTTNGSLASMAQPSLSISSIGTLGTLSVAGDSKSATAQFTASTTPGQVTITGSYTGLADGTVTLNTVVIGVPARLAVSADASTTVGTDPTDGQAVTVTVLDANGNRVTNYDGYVKITASGSSNSSTAAVYNDDSISATQVVYQHLTAAEAGSFTFYAVDTKANTVTYSAAAYTVSGGSYGVVDATIASASTSGAFVAGDAAGLAFSWAPSSITGDGSSVSVLTVKVVDANQNTVTGATGTMKFQIPSSSGGAYAFISGAGSDGWYTATVSGGVATAVVQGRSLPAGSGASGTVKVEAQYYKDGASVTTYDVTTSNAQALTISAPSAQ